MNIHTILYQYIKGDVTDEDRRKILRWLQEDKAHEQEYLSLRKLYDLNVWNAEEKQKSSLPQKKSISIRKISLKFLKIASILIFGILTTYFFMKESYSSQTQMIYVPFGQRSELFLSDGTQVWLNSGTTLNFPENFSQKARNVTLDGEAYFKVAKNKDKPFIVHSEQHNIKVLGTEFNVKAYQGKNSFETALLEGSIEILSIKDEKAYIIEKNETLSFKEGKMVKEAISDFNYFKWRDGLICFEKESLISLFEKLELYYDIRIVNKNESLKKGSYTGKFRIRDGIEHVLKVLQLKHQFTYKKDDDANMITIE